MAAKSLADRVAALEAKVGSKTIQEQFREQAELIDRLFIYRFDEFDEKWDVKLETKLEPIRSDLATVKDDVAVIKDVVKVILSRL